MGKNRKLTILRDLADQIIAGNDLHMEMFAEYLKVAEIDDNEATAILKEVYAKVKPDMLQNNIAFYLRQNRSEELTEWLKFTLRFVKSVKKDPDKLHKNARYWLDKNATLTDRVDQLIQANIIYQVNDELF